MIVDRLNEALQGRYELQSELGRGGMATVYLATDARHDRTVALKVLDPQLAASVGRARFEREIEISATLVHPHILTLIDSGSVDGMMYYVMPSVDGGSLRDRLRLEATLPLEEALRITKQVASALSYAHGRGYVHRDVKPENVLLAQGEALVADFGIARAIEVASGGTRLTKTGLAVGTALYMSPEQSFGEVALDGRSDLYSLACVAYEMLIGEAPFTAPTLQGMLAKRLGGIPVSLRERRPEVPLFLERALGRALAFEPSDRFNSVSEFVEALNTELVVDEVHHEGAETVADVVRATSLQGSAYENYMRGRVHQERFTPEDLSQALRYYEAVLDEAPGYAPAHAGVALVIGSRLVLGVTPALEDGPRWRQAAERAIRLDPALATAHSALAQASMWFEWDWEAADSSFRRSIELDPNDPQTRSFYGHYLAAMRRPVEARAQAARAIELDPRNPFHRVLFAGVYQMERDFARAEAEIRAAMELAPNNALAHWVLGTGLFHLGRLTEASRSVATFFGALGDTQLADILGEADGDAAVRLAALHAAEILVERSRQVFVKPEVLSYMFDWAGEVDRAVEWVERGYEQRDHQLAYAQVLPYSNALLADDRYQEVVRRLGFPSAAAR